VRTGISLVIVTHNERLAAGMGRTIRFVDGRINEHELTSRPIETPLQGSGII
jgi:ABC-type lipoprotein export system ATPase subunit